jgi:hypothetical protein
MLVQRNNEISRVAEAIRGAARMLSIDTSAANAGSGLDYGTAAIWMIHRKNHGDLDQCRGNADDTKATIDNDK